MLRPNFAIGLVLGLLLCLQGGCSGAKDAQDARGEGDMGSTMDAADSSDIPVDLGDETSSNNDSHAELLSEEDAVLEVDIGADVPLQDLGDVAGIDDVFDVAFPPDLAPEMTADVTWPDPPGSVTGSCGDLAALLAAGAPTLITNSYQFAIDAFDKDRLVPGAQKRYELDNVGGSSLCSEVMSIQLLAQCDGALLYKTESEIVYATEGDKADYIVVLADTRVGVSVTRAYKGPFIDTYTHADATELLTKKLNGLTAATGNVAAEDAWQGKLLHVWTMRTDWVPVVEAAYAGLDAGVKGDIVVMVTVEDGAEWIVAEECK